MQLIYSNWVKPECTSYTHRWRSYTTTFRNVQYTTRYESSLTEWAAVQPTVRRGGPVHSDASGPQTSVLAIVRCCNHTCYISFLGPIKPVCTRYCSILAQGAIIGSVLNRQGRTTAVNTNGLLPPTHAFFLPGLNIEINLFLTISDNWASVIINHRL